MTIHNHYDRSRGVGDAPGSMLERCLTPVVRPRNNEGGEVPAPERMQLDRKKPNYLYQQMADHLAARIRSGELVPNKALPHEAELATRYGVSLGTARRATRLLREYGLVITLRSKGSYVAPPDRWLPVPKTLTASHEPRRQQEV